MSGYAGFSIDWREQFTSLDPFLAIRRGGVIHIDARSEAPVSAFARVLRARVRDGCDGAIAVQIDPLNSNTHYLRDVVSQIARSASIGLEPMHPDRNVVVNVGTDIKSRGDISLSNIEIALNGLDEGPEITLEAIPHLTLGLRKVLRQRKVVLIFVNSQLWSTTDLRRINEHLWQDALSSLIDEGLVVINIGELAETQERCDGWLMPPDLVLSLPAEYDNTSKAAALEDLVRIASDASLFESEMEVAVFARTLVSSLSVRELHAKLAVVLARLKEPES